VPRWAAACPRPWLSPQPLTPSPQRQPPQPPVFPPRITRRARGGRTLRGAGRGRADPRGGGRGLPGGSPAGSCRGGVCGHSHTQPRGLEGLLQIGAETILSGTSPLKSAPRNIRYLPCKRLSGFSPLHNLRTVSHPCFPGWSWGGRCGEQEGRLLPRTAQPVLSGIPSRGSPPLPQRLGAPSSAGAGDDDTGLEVAGALTLGGSGKGSQARAPGQATATAALRAVA